MKFETRSAPVSPKDTSDLNADEGQHIIHHVLQAALEHKRKRSEGLYRTRSDWGLYEEILPDTPILPGPLETLLKTEEEEPDSVSKIGDATARAEMTMPKSPIMGESAEKRSTPWLEKESLVSAMAREITIGKERERESSLLLERSLIQSEIDFDKKCKEASDIENESIQWPPVASIYGVWYYTTNQFKRERSQFL